MEGKIAAKAHMQSFFNCYMRETGNFRFVSRAELLSESFGSAVLDKHPSVVDWILCDLEHHQIKLIVPVIYRSKIGRHLFAFPFFYTVGLVDSLFELDLLTMVTLLTKELAITNHIADFPAELVYRVLQSTELMNSIISSRLQTAEELYQLDFDFLKMEQSLVYGHLLHPTPKSRQGLSEVDQVVYSPEMKGSFPLHYFAVHKSIIREDSHFQQSTTQLIKEEINQDSLFDQALKDKYLHDDKFSLLPTHPLQTEYLLQDPNIHELLMKGLLVDLGKQGKAYYSTSSFRTLFSPDSKFMYKCSVNVQITNSRRLNKYKELERGLEITRLLDQSLGQELRSRYPQFQIVRDPAFITVSIEGLEESGFELALRENPFDDQIGEQVSLVAGLCQDALPNHKPIMYEIISNLAKREGRSVEEVSKDWFDKYLSVVLEPMLWLYFQYGVALEAHQQNSLIGLKNGYPNQYYYRDNQGYYYCESTLPLLEKILPGISQKSKTVCPDEVVDERLRYYLFQNHLFGVIQAFGAAGLVPESELLNILSAVLQNWRRENREPSTLVASLLEDETITCKANLLTRLYDMDELIGSVSDQSKYVEVVNPLAKGNESV